MIVEMRTSSGSLSGGALFAGVTPIIRQLDNDHNIDSVSAGRLSELHGGGKAVSTRHLIVAPCTRKLSE